jgi:hypothetical protein
LLSPALVADVPETQPINAHVAPPRKEDRSVLPIVLGVAAALAILTMAMLFLAMQRGKIEEPPVAFPPATDRPADAQSGSAAPSPRPEGLSVGPKDRRPALRSRPVVSPPQSGAARDRQETSGTDQQPGAPDTPDQKVADAAGDAPADGTDPDTATDDLPTEFIDDPFMNDPDDSPGATESPADGPRPQPTAAEFADLSRTLQTAKNAVGEHEFGIARMQVGKAAGLARLPAHQAMVTRLDRLIGLSQQFWTIVRQAMSELRGAEELPIGDSGLIVIVVDVQPDAITIRRSGRNETYLVADMPPGLAFAIADRRLAANAVETPLMKGACLGAMKNPKQIHVEEAKRYWELARTKGAEVDDLLATLTDSYELK